MIWFTVLASGLSFAAKMGTQIDTVETRWLGGRIVHEHMLVEGLPVEGPPAVIMMDRAGDVRRRLRETPSVLIDSFDPVVSAETAAEEVMAGWLTWPRDRGTLVVFPGGHRARLAWRFQVAAADSIWRVWVDADDGTVFHAEVDSWTADTWVYDPNSVQADIGTHELLGLETSGHLEGEYVFATSCVDWLIDPRPFGERICLDWEHTSKANPLGDHFHSPKEGMTSDPFTEGQVYVYVDRIARWAISNFGLWLGEPIQVFTNFPLTNAFFGDFDGDGDRDLSFGISDDGYNFGYDTDVIYHEFGHALVRKLAGSMWMQADSLGVDWTPGALNEGMADTFAMIQNPDPILAESLSRSDRWDKGIRDLSVPRTCPGDLQSQVHRSGRIWGSTVWRMIEHPDVGPDLVADIMVAAVSTWSNGTNWPDAAESVLMVTEDLLADDLIGPASAEAITIIIKSSGMLECERIIDLEQTDNMRLTLINYGFRGDYERVPGGVQFKHRVDPSVDHLRLRIDNFTGFDRGTGLAVYLRIDSPVEHEATRVEGIGLHHAIPVYFDAVLEIDSESAEIRIDSDTLPGFEPGVVVYGSVASVNIDRDPLDVVYLSVILSADAVLETGKLDVDQDVGGGCSTGAMRLAPKTQAWLYFCLFVMAARRRSGRH